MGLTFFFGVFCISEDYIVVSESKFEIEMYSEKIYRNHRKKLSDDEPV